VSARALACIAVLVLGGCVPRGFGWEFDVPDEIDARTRAFQAHVIPDGCVPGPRPERPLETATYRFARGEAPPVPIRSLPPGTWGFEIEALDAECRPIGRGCVPVELPSSDGRVFVPLMVSTTVEPTVCRTACANGLCLGPGVDAGQSEQDAGGSDASSPEPDAGP
jgi:hypothetical protein